MRVIVLGAGVVGVTTAWYLARAGHHVSLIDRAREVATGTSYANACQLSYSFTEPLAQPSLIARLPLLLAGRDPGMRLGARPGLDLLPWSLRLLRECRTARARSNTLAVLRLALRSAALMDELRAELAADFSFRAAGKIVLLRNAEDVAAAEAVAAMKRSAGCDTEVLGHDELLRLEPALSEFRSTFCGAVYAPGDHVADARAFSRALHARLQRDGVLDSCLGEEVVAIRRSGRNGLSVETGPAARDAAAVVVCLGEASAAVLRPLGLRTDVYPLRGYSVTLPCGVRAPDASVTDLHHKIAICRIGNQVRIAGFADLVGRDVSRDPERVRGLLATARRIAPAVADFDHGDLQAWGGFRPMTPDGRPRVGATRIPGLYVNVGHGMLGWTLACVTGHDVAAAVTAAR